MEDYDDHLIAILQALKTIDPFHMPRAKLQQMCLRDLGNDFMEESFDSAINTLLHRPVSSIEYVLDNQFRITAEGKQHLVRLLEERDSQRLRYQQFQHALSQEKVEQNRHVTIVVLTLAGIVIALWFGWSGTGNSDIFTRKVSTQQRFLTSEEFVFETGEGGCSIPVARPLLGTMVSGFTTFPVIDNGFEYPISATTVVVETEAGDGPYYNGNPSVICVRIRQPRIRRIQLLLNMSYGLPRYVHNKRLGGQQVGQVVFVETQGTSISFDLRANDNIVEWVGEAGGGRSVIWAGKHSASGQPAYINSEFFTFSNPRDIEYLKLVDLSQNMFSENNPGLMLFGMLIEHD